MKTRTLLGLFVSGLLLGAALFTTGFDLEPFTFAGGSSASVEGTSSLHDWNCTAGQVSGVLHGQGSGDSLEGIEDVQVTIPVTGMDCRNGTMNGKMRDALKADQHGAIRYDLDLASVSAPAADGWFTVNATGTLTIAGTARPIRMNVRGKALGNERFRFTGQTPLVMTDFGVRPPTAMLGTLKTGDRVTVSFDVTVAR